MKHIWTKSTLSLHKLHSKCPPLAWTHAECRLGKWSKMSWPRQKSTVQDAPDMDEPPFQFIHTMDLSVIGTMLHGCPDLVIHRTEMWAVWRPQVQRKEVWRFTTQQFNCCTCAVRCASTLSCWNRKSLPDTLRIVGSSMTSYMTSWSSIFKEVNKRYHQNFLLCSNNEITVCIAHLFNSFCEEVYAVEFFKVVQQQTIGEVGNWIICLWADNFCLQQWTNYYNRTVFANVMLKWKRVQFFDSQCIYNFREEIQGTEAVILLVLQETQLSQRGSAMLDVVENIVVFILYRF